MYSRLQRETARTRDFIRLLYTSQSLFGFLLIRAARAGECLMNFYRLITLQRGIPLTRGSTFLLALLLNSTSESADNITGSPKRGLLYYTRNLSAISVISFSRGCTCRLTSWLHKSRLERVYTCVRKPAWRGEKSRLCAARARARKVVTSVLHCTAHIYTFPLQYIIVYIQAAPS